MRKVVLLACGSFNPPTIMHLRMFEMARDHLESLRHDPHSVLAGLVSPVHDKYGKAGLLSSNHRVNMVKLAMEAPSSIPLGLSSWETEQADWTRTRVVMDAHQDALVQRDIANAPWLTLIDSEEDLTEAKMYLVIGDDVLKSFSVPGLWAEEDIRHILDNYGLVVISRGEGVVAQRLVVESEWLRNHQQNIHLVTSEMGNDISSTKVRLALRQGKSVLHIVPKNVIDYIAGNLLYNSN